MILNLLRIVLMFRRVLAAAVAAVLATALSACGSASANDATLRAVAAFYPLQWVTEQVAGPDWEITGLTRPGAEPHDLEIGIRETAEVDRADLVVFERGLQPGVDETVDNVATGVTLDAAEAIELRPLEADADHEEHDEHEEHEGHDHEHGHEPGDLDPHFWLDPLLMADLGDTVAEELSTIDPKGAAEYAERAAGLRTELTALDTAYDAGLSACERDLVVVTHDAFGYLSRYGLHFESIVGLSPDAEPTPAALAHLHELIDEEGLTTVFSERLASTVMAESLAADTGTRTALLDPVEGAGPSGEDYLTLMHANLAALQEANGC